MDLVPFFILGGLAILFLWGLLAPRSQWRALVSWTYRDAKADEPSGIAYGIHRIIAGFGIIALAAGGLASWQLQVESAPTANEPPTAVERMWGWKHPPVLNRVVTPPGSPRADLVEQRILGYQVVDGQRRQPPYLLGLEHFEVTDAMATRIVGVSPSPGLVALDSAELVLFISADPACIPMGVVVVEGEELVKVAVYYGRPDATPAADKGAGADAVADSDADRVALDDCSPGLRDRQPLLIPVSLTAPLEDRAVVTLDDAPVRMIPVITD